MSIQALLISVAVTVVTVGITFLYFRNRMNKTEQKVDLMFQLIQEHERNSRMTQQMQKMQVMSNNETVNNLINISDDENAEDYEDDNDIVYDSDDSAVVSDTENENENKLVIDNENDKTQAIDLADTVKTISLSLDGAETSNTETLETNDTDNIIHQEDDELDEVELSDVDSLRAENGSVEHVEEKSNDDGTLNNFVVTKKITHEGQENDDSHTEQADNYDDKVSSNDEQLSSNNENYKPNIKPIISSINYTKLSKAQLKQIAQEKGLVGYNKLTKGGLVDLLNTTP